MQLFNNLTRNLEKLTPEKEDFTLYACGITPYDTTHLGHAFTYTCIDILIRYLEFLSHSVIYVQNVTDVDDDILRRAREVGEDWRALGNQWTSHFIHDMMSLNVLAPAHFPRATDFISEIQEWVRKLLDAGVAYQAEGSVYFHIDSYPEFGKLSRLPRPEMLTIANERGNRPNDPNKRDPLDFVLWQAQASGEPGWESPWGPGRPGWHIECSTMATRLLGEVIDIHVGGSDLAFPHHECEVAQVEPVTQKTPCVRFWMHIAMVHHEGEKMSKSLGNLIMVRDLLEAWSPDSLRLYLGCHHYREIWRHEIEVLERSARLAQVLRSAAAAINGQGSFVDPSPTMNAFHQAMDADLDTPSALSILEHFATQILDASASGKGIGRAQHALRTMGKVFGLQLDTEGPEVRVLSGWQEHLKHFTHTEA
ncbi:MAG: cysteine--tRNA ligase [Chloroflexi bacterium RBG_16_48_8]|nr:MAG: cysteine--tRNA ligase [Chloroflexi bacterium RBG_16_48_8]